MRILPFEDPDLTLIPMAARRALDRAGVKLSLRAWQGLSLFVRETVVSLGAEPQVRAERVLELLEAADPPAEPTDPAPEPEAAQVPRAVRRALHAEARQLSSEAWTALPPVARFALFSYARRAKRQKLIEAYDSLSGSTSSGRSQSSR